MLLGAGLILAAQVSAERAPAKQFRREQRAIFDRVGQRLNCFCGCHGQVGDCGHVDEGCFGVQARRFIETRIQERMSEDEIVTGFVTGFGARVESDAQLVELSRIGRADLIQGFVHGFGERILYKPPAVWPIILMSFALAIVAYFLLRRLLTSRPRHVPQPQTTGDSRELMQRVNKLIDGNTR